MDLSLVGLDALLAGQNLVSVAVKLGLSDNNVGRVDTNVYSVSVGLITSNLLNVNNELSSVNLGDLAANTLVSSTNDQNFIVLRNGKRANL